MVQNDGMEITRARVSVVREDKGEREIGRDMAGLGFPCGGGGQLYRRQGRRRESLRCRPTRARQRAASLNPEVEDDQTKRYAGWLRLLGRLLVGFGLGKSLFPFFVSFSFLFTDLQSYVSYLSFCLFIQVLSLRQLPKIHLAHVWCILLYYKNFICILEHMTICIRLGFE
jgi:hypothetical protein